MPRTAKPSGGCSNCKRSHVKCDEAKPECGRCVRAKRVCPGYVTGLDLVLRPQNAVARATVERRQKTREKERPSSDCGFETSETSALSPASSATSFSSSSSTTSIPPVMPESEALHILSFFFTSYVLYPHDPNTDRGYMEALPVVYKITSSSSPLVKAVAAVAHVIYDTWAYRIRDLDRFQASSLYTDALSAISKALMDPVEAAKDETMMAICLLGFYDAMVDAYRSKVSSSRHFKGAAALIEQRKGKPRSQLFKRLTVGIRGSLVERAIDQGTSVDTSSAVWQDLEYMPQNPATVFDMLSAEAANVLAEAKTVLGDDNIGHVKATQTDAANLIQRAIACDSNLASWPSIVPTHLFPMPLQAATVPPKVVEAGLYADTCDLYYDVNTCTLWNHWRALRIKVLKIVAKHGTQAESAIAIKSLQSLADEICAAIPFILGDRSVFTPLWASHVVYPGGKYLSKSHHLIAAAHGGWYILVPMREVFYIAKLYLRAGQWEWIGGQLTRLKTIYKAVHS